MLQIRNVNNTVVANYEYDAWGKVVSIKYANGNDINVSNHIGVINPIRYRGYYYDSETGFYYLKSRYYDPAICRFISADSLLLIGSSSSSLNLFAYCGNNPVNRVDYGGNFFAELWDFAQAAASEIGKAIFPKIHQPFQSSCRYRLSCVFVIPFAKLRVAAAVIFLHFHKFDQQFHLLRQQHFPVLHTVAEHFPNKFFFGKPQFNLAVLHITTGAVEGGAVGIADDAGPLPEAGRESGRRHPRTHHGLCQCGGQCGHRVQDRGPCAGDRREDVHHRRAGHRIRYAGGGCSSARLCVGEEGGGGSSSFFSSESIFSPLRYASGLIWYTSLKHFEK